MSGLSRLVALDQDALRCPAGIYEQLRARGVHYAPEVDAFVVASLARLEGRVVIEVLLDRLAALELTTPVAALPYGPSFVNHGPVRLSARLTFRES